MRTGHADHDVVQTCDIRRPEWPWARIRLEHHTIDALHAYWGLPPKKQAPGDLPPAGELGRL